MWIEVMATSLSHAWANVNEKLEAISSDKNLLLPVTLTVKRTGERQVLRTGKALGHFPDTRGG
jgi:hypothetical protein